MTRYTINRICPYPPHSNFIGYKSIHRLDNCVSCFLCGDTVGFLWAHDDEISWPSHKIGSCDFGGNSFYLLVNFNKNMVTTSFDSWLTGYPINMYYGFHIQFEQIITDNAMFNDSVTFLVILKLSPLVSHRFSSTTDRDLLAFALVQLMTGIREWLFCLAYAGSGHNIFESDTVFRY